MGFTGKVVRGFGTIAPCLKHVRAGGGGGSVVIVLFILHHFVLVKGDTSDVALVIRDIVWARAWMRPRGADRRASFGVCLVA